MRATPIVLALAAATICSPSPSRAQQEAWLGPSLMSPHAPQGLSALLVGHDGGALGVLGHWRRDAGGLGLGYRAGLTQGGDDGLAALGGVDVSGILSESVEDADVQVLWWSGLGAWLADDLGVSVPAGLVAAWKGMGDGNAFAPYAGGHVTLGFVSRGGDSVELTGALDLGLDLTLDSGWVVRFGASLSRSGAVGVGVRVPARGGGGPPDDGP